MTHPARTALLLCLLLASACPGGGAGEVGGTGGGEGAPNPATAPTGDTGSPPTTTEALTNDTGVLTDTTGPIDPTASTDPTATTPSNPSEAKRDTTSALSPSLQRLSANRSAPGPARTSPDFSRTVRPSR